MSDGHKTEQRSDEALLEALRQQFDSGVDALSEFDRARLARARRKALAVQPRRSAKKRGWIVPLAAAASLGLLGLLLVPMTMIDSPGSEPEVIVESADTSGVTDLEILLAEEELSLFAELEFYLWVEHAMSEESQDAG